MKDGRVGFGIVGCGVIGPWHASAIHNTERAVLLGCCDLIEERAKKLGEDHAVPWTTDLDRLLDNAAIDVINICVPSGLHAEIGVRAAEAGKHLLCEKPLDVTLDSIDRLLAKAKEKGVKLACIFQRRFEPDSLRVKRAIEAGKLGQLYIADAYLKYWRTQEYYDSGDWRGTWKLDGGGCLMNQGVHGIDLLQWLAGKVKSVYAYTDTVAHQRIEVEDVALALLEFENGARGVLEGATSAFEGFPTVHEFHGELGSVGLQEGQIRFWTLSNPTDEDKELLQIANQPKKPVDTSDPQAVLAALGDSHRPQIEDLCEAVLEDREPACTGEDARHAVEIILAVYKSAREGRKVALPL